MTENGESGETPLVIPKLRRPRKGYVPVLRKGEKRRLLLAKFQSPWSIGSLQYWVELDGTQMGPWIPVTIRRPRTRYHHQRFENPEKARYLVNVGKREIGYYAVRACLLPLTCQRKERFPAIPAGIVERTPE